MEVSSHITKLINSSSCSINIYVQCDASDWVLLFVITSHSSGPFNIVIGSPNYEDFNNWVVYANSSGFTITASTTTEAGVSQTAIIVPVTVNSQVQYSVYEYVNAVTGVSTTGTTSPSATSSATNFEFSGKSFGIGVAATLGFIILLSVFAIVLWRSRKLRKTRFSAEQVDVPAEGNRHSLGREEGEEEDKSR